MALMNLKKTYSLIYKWQPFKCTQKNTKENYQKVKEANHKHLNIDNTLFFKIQYKPFEESQKKKSI